MLLRKDAAGGNDPTYDIELWETGGAAPLAILASGVTLSSDMGVVVSATWDASLLGTPDGSAVELKVVGHRSGGSPSKRRTVEVGAVEWNVQHEGSPPGGLYYLRARYYDPETGRFLSKDRVPGSADYPAAQHPYAYALNNPCSFVDPSGNLAKESGLYKTTCYISGKAEGAGRHRIPPSPFHAGICLVFKSFCPKIYDDDVLFEFAARVSFLETASGTRVSVEKVDQYGTQYGWRSLGYGTSTNSDNFGAVHALFAGGPLNLTASVTVGFRMNDDGDVDIQADLHYRGSGVGGTLAGLVGGIGLNITSKGCTTLPAFRGDPTRAL